MSSSSTWLHVSILYTDWFVGGQVCDVSVLNVACFVAGLSAAVSLFSGGTVPPSCRILFQPLDWKVSAFSSAAPAHSVSR